MTAVTVSSGSEGAQRSSGGEDRQAGVLCTPLDTAIFASASHGDWERDDAEGATATVLVRAALRFVLRGYAPPLLGVLKLLVPKPRDHTSPQLKQGTMKKRLGVVTNSSGPVGTRP